MFHILSVLSMTHLAQSNSLGPSLFSPGSLTRQLLLKPVSPCLTWAGAVSLSRMLAVLSCSSLARAENIMISVVKWHSVLYLIKQTQLFQNRFNMWCQMWKWSRFILMIWIYLNKSQQQYNNKHLHNWAYGRQYHAGLRFVVDICVPTTCSLLYLLH